MGFVTDNQVNFALIEVNGFLNHIDALIGRENHGAVLLFTVFLQLALDLVNVG